MTRKPFDEGDRVEFRDEFPPTYATVLKCQADPHGFDVLVLPEAIYHGKTDPFWIGSDQLVLNRAG